MLAAEAVPFVKTGEVSEVVSSLAKALHKLGHDVRLAIPRYCHISPQQFGLELVADALPVPMDNHHEPASVYRASLPGGVPVYMVDSPRYFGRTASCVYVDDAERFIFSSRAALEMLRHPAISWQPDIIHCHDWQTAIVPNWLATIYKDEPFFSHTASVFTIHRLAHQGIFGYRVLEVAGLNGYGFLHHAEIADLADLVDLLARGVYYAQAITTVSERYAQEIQTAEFGERLDPLLREHRERLFGILNGIDTETLDPARDSYIASRFDAQTLERRAPNKLALQRLAGLREDPSIPLVGMVSRLSDLKGFDILTPILEGILAHLGVQLMIVGIGEPKHQDQLSALKKRFPGRLALQLTYNDAVERQVYAGSDLYLMPSHVEPCGLGQMIAMRYGAVPVVHATGGLADTVLNYDPQMRIGNGFSFEAYEPLALYATLVRAVEIYRHHELWAPLQQRCMAEDFSWDRSAARYVDIYRWALATRAQGLRS
jgi:starch synthase